MNRNRKASSRTADPGLIRALVEEGRARLAEGEDEAALDLACRAIRLSETDATRAFFVACVSGFAYFPGAEEMQHSIVRALRERWTEPTEILGCVLEILRRHQVIGPLLRRATAAWPLRPAAEELLGPDGLLSLAGVTLFTTLLQTTPVPVWDFEILLTSLRCALLELAPASKRISPDALTLYVALAQQCSINEYVFDVTDSERRRTDELRIAAAALAAAKSAIPAHWIATLAAYDPLESLPFRNALTRGQPPAMATLLSRQLTEPEIVRRHQRDIPRLTAIDDTVSVAVRAQYEANPYPRWVKATPPETIPSFTHLLKTKFDFTGFQPMRSDGLDVLVAGCGTGRQAARYGQSFPNAKVLGVDLSLASLSYAKEKTAEAGAKNVSYAQADILRLNELGLSFDVIVATGVLHHMAEPLMGWQTLLDLLRPCGVMNVALYSKVARSGISHARRWLSDSGYTATREDICRARQDLVRINEPEWQSIFKMPDFYSMSECRDLLFHEHEQLFTLPQISRFLREHDLRFVGLEVRQPVRRRFMARFPGASPGDLELWHQFETENPETFLKMYQFWICRNSGEPNG